MSNRPKFAPPTVFVRMDGGGKPNIENGPSTPSNVKILGPRGGGRPQQQGRPGNGQQNGRPQQQQMNGGGRQLPQRQPQFAPPQQNQFAQPYAPILQLSTPQLTLCRTLVHGYLKKGIDEIGEDNLKLSAVTLDMLDNMLGHAAAIAPAPAPRAARPPRPPAIAAPPPPDDLDFDPQTGEPIDVEPQQPQRGGIAPRRVVRATSSIGMVPGLVAAPAPEIASGIIDVHSDDIGEIDDQPPG